MAVVLAFRLAIALSPAALRVVQSGQPPPLQQAAWLGEALWRRLADPDESDEDLAAAVSAASGTVSAVATYEAPFEVRRLQVNFTQDSGAVGGEDVRVITFHLIKLAGGVPTVDWLAADFTTVRDALIAFWTSVKPKWIDKTVLTRSAFYKAGPGIEPPQPPVNVVDHALPGTHVSTSVYPPQVALSVTEKTGLVQKHWGRFYLPAMATDFGNNFGRPVSTNLDAIADALNVMYEAWRGASLPAVVYLEALPERSPTAPDPRHRTKGTFPPRGAMAKTVDDLQIDNVFDVIRSRRYDRPTLRVQRGIG